MPTMLLMKACKHGIFGVCKKCSPEMWKWMNRKRKPLKLTKADMDMIEKMRTKSHYEESWCTFYKLLFKVLGTK